MAAAQKVCVLTGAHGFVGGGLRLYLESHGWRVVGWSREPDTGEGEVQFRLGEDVNASLFSGVDALVHCAYDFEPRQWDEIAATNVAGSEKLLRAARQAGLKHVVVISSLSAFTGCRSLYGKAKVETEAHALAAGAYVLRPGLVYGDNPGGMFGRLVAQVKHARLLPVLWGGNQLQYLVHQLDLGHVVHTCLEGRLPPPAEPLPVAHDRGWELKVILRQLARTLGKRVWFLPVPWQLVWLALKSMETAGLKPRFRSDSLISMVYQNPRPNFAALRALGFNCRPFRLEPGMIGQ